MIMTGLSAQKFRNLFVATLVLTAVSISGCNTVPSQVNSAIASKLPTALGPADHYSVTSNGDILELFRGKLRSIHVHGDQVQLSPLLTVSSFDVDAYNIHANTKTDALMSIGRVTFQASLNQANLDSYMLAAQPDNVKHGARVILNGNQITYRDNVGVLSVRTPFSVTGIIKPHVGNTSQLDFQASKASLSHLTIPQSWVTIGVNHDNPVVDLSQMKYPVSITSSNVNNSILTITGSVDLSALIGTAPGGNA